MTPKEFSAEEIARLNAIFGNLDPEDIADTDTDTDDTDTDDTDTSITDTHLDPEKNWKKGSKPSKPSKPSQKTPPSELSEDDVEFLKKIFSQERLDDRP